MINLGLLIGFLIIPLWPSKSEPIRAILVYETSNLAAETAFKAVQNYVQTAKIPGLSLGEVNLIPVDSSLKFLNVDQICNVYDKSVQAGTPPHLVFDLTWSGISTEVVRAFTRNLGLPTVSGSYGTHGEIKQWQNISASQNKYLIQVMPPGDIIPYISQLIASVQNMTNAALLYDESFDLEDKYKTLFKSRGVRHMITRISNGGINTQLRNLVDIDMVNFFVFAKVDHINQVLSAANNEKFFGKKFSWYLFSKEDGDVFVKAENASVIFSMPTINPTIASTSFVQTVGLNAKPAVDGGFYFDLVLRAFMAVKNMMDAKDWPANMTYSTCNSSYSNPVVRSNLDLRTAFKLANVSSVFAPLLVTNDNGKSYPQLEMTLNRLDFQKGRLASKTNLGTWMAGSPGSFQFIPGNSIGAFAVISVYRVAVVVQAPFVMKRKNSNGTIEFYGYCIDLLNNIQKILKFEYILYETPDGEYGTMDDKMNWNGMIRELIDKNADIGLGALAVMAERENVIDFTVPYYDLVGISILMKKPSVSTSLFKFLTVLENDVWGCILAAYFFTSVLLWIFDRWSPYSYQNNKEKYKDDPEEEKREFTLKESLWFCMTSLTPQGGGEAPKHLSGRLIAATWWLFGFIIIASYTANLAAFLTVSRLDSPVNSLDDLANQYKIQYAPVNGSPTMTYFQRMAYIEQRFYEIWKDMSLNDSMTEVERAKLAVWDYPVSDRYTKIWQSMQDAGLPKTFEEALARVRASESDSDGFAFLGDATDIRYQELTNCDLQMIGEEFSRKPYALAVQDGSPLRDQLNDAILRLLNQRTLETLKETWWTSNPERKTCDDSNDQSDGISIQNIGGVFIVIFVGIILACLTLAVEYCWYKVYRRQDLEAIKSIRAETQAKLADDIYTKTKNQAFVIDRKNDGAFNTDYGYFGSKNEPAFGADGPRPRKAW